MILHRNRSVSQAELIDLFWPEEDTKNPLSALKVLILRIRNLLEPLCENPILSQRSAYQWNPSIPCVVDAEIFEKLCQLAAQPDTPLDRKLELYQEAVKLYKGDLLPKQNGQQWVIPLSSRYRNCYSSAMKEYAALLQETGLYAKMSQVALSACNLLPLDEQLHMLVIRSYILQKKHSDALEHYKKATKVLYQTLGIPPTAELQAVYTEILSEEKDMEINLDTILSAMSAPAKPSGAFFCEYGVFRSISQLDAAMDTQQFPKAFQQIRTFSDEATSAPIQEIPVALSAEEMMPEESISSLQGKKATFLLHITMRRNASWQGFIDWLDGNPRQTFDSTLEFLNALNQRLSIWAAVGQPSSE